MATASPKYEGKKASKNNEKRSTRPTIMTSEEEEFLSKMSLRNRSLTTKSPLWRRNRTQIREESRAILRVYFNYGIIYIFICSRGRALVNSAIIIFSRLCLLILLSSSFHRLCAVAADTGNTCYGQKFSR
mmetsp:Transcript_8395/g.13604  ORF Transcript_8395/g.13604 Transcript_8395/m.13604 type:complete len:130 (+) Transcript_8395:198-587(+)